MSLSLNSLVFCRLGQGVFAGSARLLMIYWTKSLLHLVETTEKWRNGGKSCLVRYLYFFLFSNFLFQLRMQVLQSLFEDMLFALIACHIEGDNYSGTPVICLILCNAYLNNFGFACKVGRTDTKREVFAATDDYSLCRMTTRPIIPSMAVFIQGCSDSMMVTYPTNGMYPTIDTAD